MVNEATTRANEATRSAAQRGLGAHQLLLEGHGQRFAGSRSACHGLPQHFLFNAYATHRRRRTLRVWRSTTWTLATGSSAASTTSTPLSNPTALASPQPARTAPVCLHMRAPLHCAPHISLQICHLSPHSWELEIQNLQVASHSSISSNSSISSISSSSSSSSSSHVPVCLCACVPVCRV